MIDVFTSMQSWSGLTWGLFGAGLVLIYLKYKLIDWAFRRVVRKKPLENWASVAPEKGRARVVGAGSVRVAKRSTGDLAKVVFAVVFFLLCGVVQLTLGYEDLVAGQVKARVAFVCTVILVAALPLVLWVGFARYHFDDVYVVRKRLLGLSTKMRWADVGDVRQLKEGSLTAGVRIEFVGGMVYRVPSVLIGYRDLLTEMSKNNGQAKKILALSGKANRMLHK